MQIPPLEKLPQLDFNRIYYAVAMENATDTDDLYITGVGRTVKEAKSNASKYVGPSLGYSSHNSYLVAVPYADLDTRVLISRIKRSCLVVRRCDAQIYYYAKSLPYKRVISAYYDPSFDKMVLRFAGIVTYKNRRSCKKIDPTKENIL